MESNQLRKNNWISYHGLKFQVGIIEDTYCEPIGRNEGAFDYNDCDGIKLTGAILEKSGARYLGYAYFIGKLKFDVNTIGLVRFHYSGKVSYLRHVHDLQNLYFALMGYELEIVL